MKLQQEVQQHFHPELACIVVRLEAEVWLRQRYRPSLEYNYAFGFDVSPAGGVAVMASCRFYGD